MEKKLMKSKIVIALYVIAALLLVYTCYLIGSTVAYIFSYYSAYSMTPGFGEVISYTLQTAYQPLVMTVLVYAAAKILDEVRKLNPDNYADSLVIEASDSEEQVEDPAKETVSVDTSMKKADLIALAESYGVKVSSKDTKEEIKAKILASIEK